MVDRNKLYEQLVATFVDEIGEHVAALNDGVMALESADPTVDTAETLISLFRSAHSLKGAARAVDVPPIEEVCHHLEDVFTAIRDGQLKVTSDVATVILNVADAVAEAGQLLHKRKAVPAEHFAHLIGGLQVLLSDATPGKQRSSKPIATPVSEPTKTPEQVTGQQAVGERESEPAPAQPSSSSTVSPRSLGTTVRVAEEKLDGLMAQAGELLVARQQIEIRPAEVESIAELMSECRSEYQSVQRFLLNLIQHNDDPLLRRSARLSARVEDIVEQTGESLRRLEIELQDLQRRLRADSRQLNHAGQAMQEDIHRIRMLPFSEGCAGLERVVRDIAQSTGKKVDLTIEGGDIEVDRTVLQGLRDPLLHLIRNAVDHGLESPQQRTEQGKPETGRITISAVLRGPQVDITVADDGAGIDRDALIGKLRDRGLSVPQDDHELMRSIFLPGFSTATKITDLSGRGVGMDVVKTQIETLQGTIDLSTQVGFGTRIGMSVPLTLTTISALFVRTGGQVFGIPSTNVSRLIRFRPSDIRSLNGQEVVTLGDSPIPVTTLASALTMSKSNVEMDKDHVVAVVLTTSDRELVVVVDQLIGERDAVVKNLGPQVRRVRGVSGATLLRTGKVSLLLNAATLVRGSVASSISTQMLIPDTPSAQQAKRRILVVDDSLTTRSMVKNILEAAGYDVLAAVDGDDAWSQLQSGKIEMVVSDVDMPNLDGFALTSKIRQSAQFERLPVILVTSRDTEEDQARGAEVGADCYLVKSGFHQSNILDAIQKLF